MQPQARTNRWVFRPRPNPRALLRLYCFPFAGGAAHAYTTWPQLLPESLELRGVQLPGRGPRIADPLLNRLEPLLDALLAALTPEWMEHPFALYGHSMGGLIVYELAHRLRASGGPMPAAVAISGRGVPTVEPLDPRISNASDAEVWREMARYNGTDDALLSDPETRQFFLPIIRADFGIVEHHLHHLRPPLDIPLQVSSGLRDPGTPPGSDSAWQHETTATCQLRRFAGDHFFIRTEVATFVPTLGADLERLCF